MTAEPIIQSRGGRDQTLRFVLLISTHLQISRRRLAREKTHAHPSLSFRGASLPLLVPLSPRSMHVGHIEPGSKRREETYKFLQRLVALMLRAHSERPKHTLGGLLPPALPE